MTTLWANLLVYKIRIIFEASGAVCVLTIWVLASTLTFMPLNPLVKREKVGQKQY